MLRERGSGVRYRIGLRGLREQGIAAEIGMGMDAEIEMEMQTEF